MNLVKKIGGFLAPLKSKALAVLALIGVVSVASAQDASTNEVQSLWGDLGIDLAAFFSDVFEALSTPVGVILAVIFVMAIFYLVVRLARTSISPSRRA